MPNDMLCPYRLLSSCPVAHVCVVIEILPSAEHLRCCSGKETNKIHCSTGRLNDSQEITRLISSFLHRNAFSFKLECSHLLIAVREQHEEALGRHQPDPVVGRAVPLHEQ